MKTQIRRCAAGLLVTLLAAGPVAAQMMQAPRDDTPQPAVGPFAATTAANDEVLEKATAREDISMVATSVQSSSVSNNSVNGTSTTGEIRLSDNAFQNANGMTIINANSGNNVAMNASINVNIVMNPPQQ